MTYDPHDRDGSVVVEEGGYSTGVIVGAIVVLVILAIVGLYMVGGLRLTTGNGGGNNGGDGQPLPSLQDPGAS